MTPEQQESWELRRALINEMVEARKLGMSWELIEEQLNRSMPDIAPSHAELMVRQAQLQETADHYQAELNRIFGISDDGLPAGWSSDA